MNVERFVDGLTSRGRRLSIGLLVLVTLFLGQAVPGLRVERNNRSMDSTGADQAAIEREFAERFGSDELLLLSATHPRLLHGEGLLLIDALTTEIESWDGVSRVRSLTNLSQIVAGEAGATEVPLVPRPLVPGSAPDAVEAALARNPQWTGLLVSSDRRTGGLAVEFEPDPGDPDRSDRLIDRLRLLKSSAGFAALDLHLTGIAVQKHDVTRLVQHDQSLLLPLSGLVLTLALAAVFRRRSGVLLPMLVTLTTLVWTLGIYAHFGFELNIITSLLPPVIMVLSLTTSIHLYQQWIVLARTHAPGPELLRTVVRRQLTPCFLSALTTGLGMGSLVASDVPAVRQFGLFAAVGIGISFLLNFTLIPIGLSFLTPRPKRRTGAGDWIAGWLSWAAAISVRRPLTVLGVTAALGAIGIAGAWQIRNNTDLVRFLRPQAELYRDTMFIDAQLTGANGLELVVARRDGEALTGLDDVRRIAAFEDGLRELSEVVSVVSVVDLIEQLHRAERAAGDLRLPESSADLLYCFDLLESSERQAEIGRLITPDFVAARVSLRVRAIGTAEAASVLARVDRIADSALGDGYSLQASGGFHRVTLDSNRLVASQLRSFLLALGLVLAVMAAVFRSWKLLLAALVPNLVPLAWTGGLMGWLGIDLSAATAMIASVAIGIAVDDTIHYVVRFRVEHRGDREAAIHTATTETGRVLVITSVVLTLGFWVGSFGSFQPAIHFSWLTGATIMGALICDLIVLPASLQLLRVTEHPRRGGTPTT